MHKAGAHSLQRLVFVDSRLDEVSAGPINERILQAEPDHYREKGEDSDGDGVGVARAFITISTQVRQEVRRAQRAHVTMHDNKHTKHPITKHNANHARQAPSTTHSTNHNTHAKHQGRHQAHQEHQS